jgi:hypothetical protein
LLVMFSKNEVNARSLTPLVGLYAVFVAIIALM